MNGIYTRTEIRKSENPLGRIKLHDKRSRNFAYPRTTPGVPYSVHHVMRAPNVDQFYTSGCVGFSGANFLNCAKAHNSRRVWNRPDQAGLRYLDNNDGLRNYAKSTERDPFPWTYPPDDEGSSALGLMKFWKDLGVITGYDWCFTFNQFLTALQRQPVLVGTEWFEGLMESDSKGTVPSDSLGASVGGHEYLATSINWRQQLIGFENSWGENWGLKGRFFMHFDLVEHLLQDGGDAVVPRLL